MESKQTAVEWLIEQLTPSISLQQKHIDDLKEQTKAMEREQIVQAFKHKRLPVLHRSFKAENYYNETYGAQSPKILHDPQSRGHSGQ